MDVRLARLTLVLVLAGRISGHSLDCSYNGTAYTEGEPIETEEPCLSCVCQKGALACNLKVCADFDGPLAPGCFMVQTSNECCPRLYCEDKHADDNVELHTTLSIESNTLNGCLINGSIYAEGSAVASIRLCEYCYCMQGEIRCIKPKCFQPFEDCRAIYSESSCCPTHYDCRNTTLDIPNTRNDSGCESEGVRYEEGEMINPRNSSSCESCYCTEGEIRCGPIVCSMESLEDCDPVDSPNQCCPAGFTCARNVSEIDEGFQKFILEPESKDEVIETEAYTGNVTDTTEEVTSTESPTEPVKMVWIEKAEEVNSTDSGIFLNSETTDSDTISRGALDSFFESTTTQPETMPTFDFYSTKEDSPEADARKSGEFASLEERSPQSEFHTNSSLVSEDYDSYDYEEPKLPPSLPNLVIFPFVAADAVTKDKNPIDAKSPIKVQSSIQSDFSPSWIQPEGGFVPKEPEPSGDFFMKRPFFAKDDMETFEEISTSKTDTFLGPSFVKSPENQIKRIDAVPDFLKPTYRDPFDTFIKTEEAPNLSINPGMTSTFSVGQQATKPVTVAYKNVVVDFYPDYLVTSTRHTFKTKQELDKAVPTKEHYFSRENSTVLEDLKTKKFSATKKAGPTTESFFEEFIKPFLSDPPKPTAKPNTKFKYSSKIKATQATVSTNTKDYHRDVGTTPEAQNASNSQSLFELLFGADSSAFAFSETKPAEEETTTMSSTTEEVISSTVIASNEVTASSEKLETFSDKKNELDSSKSTLGGLLKLAGCNIYGRMYRVGKIIFELSGPCLQCLCTEIGVQCKQLSC